MAHCGNAGFIKSRFIKIIKACNAKILRSLKSKLCRCFADRYGCIVIDADDRIRQLSVLLPQTSKAQKSALKIKSTMPDFIFCHSNVVILCVIQHSTKTTVTFVIFLWSHDKPEFLTTVNFMKMRNDPLHSRIIVNAYVIKIFQFIGYGNHRNICSPGALYHLVKYGL